MTIELDHIYNCDCLVGMRDIPDGSVDAVICDLPYEVLHRNNPHAQWDRMIPLEPLWEQYRRVAKPDAAIVLFAQGMFTARLMMSNPKMWRYNLVWDKQRTTGFLNANRMPLRCHEDICVFYEKLPTYNPQYTDGAPSHPQGTGKHIDMLPNSMNIRDFRNVDCAVMSQYVVLLDGNFSCIDCFSLSENIFDNIIDAYEWLINNKYMEV